ncbi:hypothetical protein D8666_22250 [Ochrobactrum soli]|nr:hypothetical protein D8666_22250 [[Ochrobactrum] soli]
MKSVIGRIGLKPREVPYRFERLMNVFDYKRKYTDFTPAGEVKGCPTSPAVLTINPAALENSRGMDR